MDYLVVADVVAIVKYYSLSLFSYYYSQALEMVVDVVVEDNPKILQSKKSYAKA